MKPKRFRVENYKSVEDTGWVDFDSREICLVGKNGFGKTSILEAIAKFFNREETPEEDITREPSTEPSGKLGTRICTIEFELKRQPMDIPVSIYSDGDLVISHEPTKYSSNEKVLDDIKIREKAQDFLKRKNKRKKLMKEKINNLSDVLNLFIDRKISIEKVKDNEDLFPDPTEKNKEEALKIYEEIQYASINIENIEKNIPDCYFLPCEKTGPSQNSNIGNIISKNIDTSRESKINKVKREFEEDIGEYWNQSEILIDITTNNNGVGLKVRNKKTGSPNLDTSKRSAGLSKFLKIAARLHVAESNDIILIDHPGIHLHPNQKKQLKEYIYDAGQNQQVVVATHSPFMIRGDMLDSIRIVQDKGEISKDILDASRETARPIYEALGIRLGHEVIGPECTLVVEGPTEYHLIPSLSYYLNEIGKDVALDSYHVLHHGGAGEIPKYAKWREGSDINLKFLLDSDKEGKAQKQKIEDNHPELSSSVFLTHGENNCKKEFEDLFDPCFYIRAVNECYEDRESFDPIQTVNSDDGIIINGEPFNGSGIADRVSSYIDETCKGFEMRKREVAEQAANILREETPDMDTEQICRLFGRIKYGGSND